MQNYIFTNILGNFIFDEKFNLIDKADSKAKLAKYNAVTPGIQELKRILGYFKNPSFYRQFVIKNVVLTKKQLKASVRDDMLIIHAIKTSTELDKIGNSLAKRLREWYELYNPEFSKSISDHKVFAELVSKKNKFELLKQIKVKPKDTMGADLSEEDLIPIREVAKRVYLIYSEKDLLLDYLGKIMEKCCPNIKVITGVTLGAKLIEQAGSLKKLAFFPSSTVQVLGAEKALFRHLKTGAKCPKYGLLHEHKFLLDANVKDQGKVARYIADKVSIAAKVDYHKGEFVGDGLLKQLEAKIKCL